MAQISTKELHNATYAHLPNIMQIIGVSDAVLDAKIQEYIEDITKVSPATQITRPHSMFTYINGAGKNCQLYADLLAYYDKSALCLYNRYSNNRAFQDKIRKKLRESILDISKHNVVDTNPTFLNHMAEVLYANQVIPTVESVYTFCGFDVRLDNGKDADLMFRRKNDRKAIYFDNVGILSMDIAKVKSVDGVIQFLRKRIDDKKMSKTKGLTMQGGDYLINNEVAEFYVAPFLWMEICALQPYKKAFREIEKTKDLNCLFVALMPQKLPDGHYTFSIETIPNILKRWEELDNRLIYWAQSVLCWLKSLFSKLLGNLTLVSTKNFKIVL